MTGWPETLTPEESRLNAILPHPPADARIPEGWLSQWKEIWAPLAASLAGTISDSTLPPVIGIHGGQGSGKSTLSLALKDIYKAVYGWNIVVISIDDLYLSYADRQSLGEEIHALLVTRGVPGTHEVDRGIQLFKTLRQLKQGDTCLIPAFDKASDDRLPESQWHQITGPVDAIIFEGWCVGCESVQPEQLIRPINALEEHEDADGIWRSWVNQQLATTYKEWFSAIDYLIMLKVPNIRAVRRWRAQQEIDNKRMAKGLSDRSLDDAALHRFIQHYERLTRQALTRLPELANLILSINDEHKVSSIETGVSTI